MKNLKKNIDVILLCGGKGQRLRPHTLKTPKPLLVVNNKPFLYFLIKSFLKLNVKQVILATGYKSEKVSRFVRKYFDKNKKIKLVDSGNVDILKRIQDCSKLTDRDFFVCYGDTYVDLNLNNYLSIFYKSKAPAIMVSTNYRIKYGTVSFNKKTYLVKKFNEKPIIKEPINLGYFIFDKKLKKKINSNKLWINFLYNLTKNQEMITHITNKKYFSFDSPREYFEIKSKFIK